MHSSHWVHIKKFGQFASFACLTILSSFYCYFVQIMSHIWKAFLGGSSWVIGCNVMLDGQLKEEGEVMGIAKWCMARCPLVLAQHKGYLGMTCK